MGLGLSIAEGRNLLGSYQTQLADAQKSLNDAVTAETAYARAHPNLSSGPVGQRSTLRASGYPEATGAVDCTKPSQHH